MAGFIFGGCGYVYFDRMPGGLAPFGPNEVSCDHAVCTNEAAKVKTEMPKNLFTIIPRVGVSATCDKHPQNDYRTHF